MQQVLEETLLVRFPAAPLALVRLLRRIQQPADVRHLIIAVQQVPDLATAEQMLSEAAQYSSVQEGSSSGVSRHRVSPVLKSAALPSATSVSSP